MIKWTFSEIGMSPKYASNYKGPFEILEKINYLTYKIKLMLNNNETIDTFHVRCLKLYFSRNTLGDTETNHLNFNEK